MTGPDKWVNQFQTCSGKYQSPIDIEEELVERVSLPPLVFQGFSELPRESVIINNGHTVMLQFNHTSPVTVSGGPLPGMYQFAQLHFHWGYNDSYGSEDTINNHRHHCCNSLHRSGLLITGACLPPLLLLRCNGPVFVPASLKCTSSSSGEDNPIQLLY
ncbi:carbonate dehydratase activity protein [Homalodisca vitripennis]|nr:carbonate dehydratase activity protein [Homalodisca vitripennis]